MITITNPVDCHGEDLMCYRCPICAEFSSPKTLITIHAQKHAHELVHEFCAVARNEPWDRCGCD